ncbi:MAG: hypothetical protein AB8B81_09225 [Halioglobus sp.]
MGWYDYFVNQDNDSDFEYEILTASPHKIIHKVPANTNVLLGRQGWCTVWMSLVKDDKRTRIWHAPSNMCQNFEFVLSSNGYIAEWDQYIHRPPGALQKKYPPTQAAFFVQAPASSIDHSDQRAKGCELAGADASSHLKEVIQNSSSFGEIFIAAANELGYDRLISGILGGPAEWSYQALLILPLEDSQREALLQKAMTEPQWAFHTARDIKSLDVSTHRKLILKAADDPEWAKHTLNHLDNLGEAREVVEQSASKESY